MGRFFKIGCCLLSLVLVGMSGWIQNSLNRQRLDPALGLTRVQKLDNAPPVLAFTTVALGSFRGIIANILWTRAAKMQEEGRFFEMVQLSDWITKLHPHFSQVWVYQAWNMSFNISVRFADFGDRWRWVRRGIELLRDQGLQYNPKDVLIYRELAWQYQFKIGYDLDEAHRYYKKELYQEMNQLFGGSANMEELLNPKTPEAQQRVKLLQERYKMNPVYMKELEDQYGSLDWRLAEPLGMYWAWVGLKNCKETDKTREQLVMLRRVIYQSLHALTLRGRIIAITAAGELRFGPRLELADEANKAYVKMLEEEQTERRGSIFNAYRNFLREVTYQMYISGKKEESKRYFELLKKDYPEFIPPDVKDYEGFSLYRLRETIQSRSHNRIQTIIMGLISNAVFNEALDREDEALQYHVMARRLQNDYEAAFKNTPRISIPPYSLLQETVLREVLAPRSGLPPLATAKLMQKYSITNLAIFLQPVTNAMPDVPARTNTSNAILPVAPQR